MKRKNIRTLHSCFTTEKLIGKYKNQGTVNNNMRLSKRGQVALEYIMIVGFILFIITALVGISYYYSNYVRGSINTNHLEKVVKDIVDEAEFVYYFGEPSKTTLKAYIPEGIKEITVGPEELSFKVETMHGESDIVWSSSVNLSGDISVKSGYRSIILEAREGYVWVNGT